MTTNNLPLTTAECIKACERIMNLNSLVMTLLCIKVPTECTYAYDKMDAPRSGKDPVVGEFYNSVGEIVLDDGLYYFLEGFRKDECFHNSLFALPSDLDETTLVNEEFEEKYCVPVNSSVCV